MGEGSAAVPLHVENVQDLASNIQNLQSNIPLRYIRPELVVDDHQIDSSTDKEEASATQLIPVIDLSRLTHEQFSQEELGKFHLACLEWGFFQLVNHGVAEEVLEKMKEDVSEFFKLPFEEKKAYSQKESSMEGYGQAFVFSEDQKLDWGDMLYLFTHPFASRNMKFWPSRPLSFRETVIKYASEMERIKTILLGLMAKNLGIAGENLTNRFKNGIQSVRMNYYPPCPEASKVLGISPHSDATGLTILLQINQVQGLQIRHHGKWFPVHILPHHSLLVNIGDVLEILSNGRYRSIEHRVVVHEEKERISVATFLDMNATMPIGPLPELIIKGDETKYKTISNDEYVKLLSSHKLDGKSLLDLMMLKK